MKKSVCLGEMNNVRDLGRSSFTHPSLTLVQTTDNCPSLITSRSLSDGKKGRREGGLGGEGWRDNAPFFIHHLFPFPSHPSLVSTFFLFYPTSILHYYSSIILLFSFSLLRFSFEIFSTYSFSSAEEERRNTREEDIVTINQEIGREEDKKKWEKWASREEGEKKNGETLLAVPHKFPSLL